MTNTLLIASIISILVAPFMNVLFRKYIEPILPERKKAISYIKKFFFFIMLYALPLVFIAVLMKSDRVVDKLFILSMCVGVGGLMFNIIATFVMAQLLILKDHNKFHGLHIEKLKEQAFLNNSNTDIFKKILEYAQGQEEINTKHSDRITSLEKIIKNVQDQIW